MVGTSADEIVTVLGDVVSEVDRRALSGALGEFIVREIGHALSPGVWGWFDDDRALFKDWGFELSERTRSARRLARRPGPLRPDRARRVARRPPRRRGAPAPGRRAPVAHPRFVRRDPRRAAGSYPSPSSPLDCAVRARNEGRPTGGSPAGDNRYRQTRLVRAEDAARAAREARRRTRGNARGHDGVRRRVGLHPAVRAAGSQGQGGRGAPGRRDQRCFSALLADAYVRGGSLLKFGGDAMLLWFAGDEHAAARVRLGERDAPNPARRGPDSRRRERRRAADVGRRAQRVLRDVPGRRVPSRAADRR